MGRLRLHHSLLSAFTEDEIAAQLAEMYLSRLLIDVHDDRHWLVSGRVYFRFHRQVDRSYSSTALTA